MPVVRPHIMKAVWSSQNYEQNLKYGQGICGLIYKNERPNKIIIDIKEIKGHHFTQQFLYYIETVLMPALSQSETAEINLVCGESL